MTSRRGRDAVAWMLVVLASAASAAALLVGYVEHAAVDSDQFANRATAALRDSSVRGLIAQRVTDQVVLEHKSDLLAARPLIQSTISSLVVGGAFTGAFRAGVRDVHRAVFQRDANTVTLIVGDLGTIAAAALDVVRPSLAAQVRSTPRCATPRAGSPQSPGGPRCASSAAPCWSRSGSRA